MRSPPNPPPPPYRLELSAYAAFARHTLHALCSSLILITGQDPINSQYSISRSLFRTVRRCLAEHVALKLTGSIPALEAERQKAERRRTVRWRGERWSEKLADHGTSFILTTPEVVFCHEPDQEADLGRIRSSIQAGSEG
ncbi:MAG: hypothetical protein LBP19_07185 [Treponema sp.]|nr:hypothetical protein [Treponema sp.]